MKLRSPRKDAAEALDVVEAVARQTSDAENLAGIVGQERLADPRTNPAVRGMADQLRDDQQRHALDYAHRRQLRTIRVADKHASDAEDALEAIRASREFSSAARSVLALHRGRDLFMRIALGASLSLSAGAAMGVDALARQYGAHPGTGYIAEVGFTGLTTLVILYKSHLTRHGGKLDGFKAAVIWAFMAAPLMASMAANALGAGIVGIGCSVGAAAFTGFSYLVANASADAIDMKVRDVGNEDESDLRRTAAGNDLFAGATAATEHVREPEALPTGHGFADDELVALGFEAAKVRDYLASRGVELSAAEVSRSLAGAARPRTDEVVNQVTQNVANLLAGLRQQTAPWIHSGPGPSRSETYRTSDAETWSTYCEDQVLDVGPTVVLDPDQTSPEVQVQPTKTQTGPTGKPSVREEVQDDRDLLAEARRIDADHLASKGRHISAENLRAALKIGKPKALDLVQEIRGTHLAEVVGQ